FANNAHYRIQLRTRNRKRSAFNDCDALASTRVTEVDIRRDYDCGSAVHLAEQIVIHQHAASSVAETLARPPDARRISNEPHPIPCATALTAASSPASPSSSSATQTFPSPSLSSSRTSSALRMWPLPRSFRPPGRKIVQLRILPADSFTSTVNALTPFPRDA